MTEIREWSGCNLGCGPRARAQGVVAAQKALRLVRTLDMQLDELRPAHNEVAPDAPLGRAWATLIGAVARAEMRGDELVVAAAPFVATKKSFVRRPPASG